MKDNFRVIIYWGGAGFVSLLTGYSISGINDFEFYKLLNLIGLLYDFLAVMLLSYAVLANNSIQDLVAHHLSLAIIAFTVLFPAGIEIGSSAGGRMLEMDGNMYAFMLISVVPMLYIYLSPVLESLPYKHYTPEKRIKVLGVILLLMGFAFQIMSSLTDTFIQTGSTDGVSSRIVASR